jgi:hypothetical protein
MPPLHHGQKSEGHTNFDVQGVTVRTRIFLERKPPNISKAVVQSFLKNIF